MLSRVGALVINLIRLRWSVPWAFVLMLARGACAQSEPPVHLTLPQCIDLALKNSALVLKNENNVTLSGELLLRTYGQFLPDLAASGAYGYTSGQRLYTFSGSNLVNQRALSPSINLNSALNLFNGLADYGGLKSALARRESSLWSLSWAKQQVMLDVIQSYLQVVLDHELLDIAQKNLAASTARLKLLQGATDVGAASRADLYRQQAQTSSDELLLSNSEASLNNAITLLIRRLRIDPQKKYEFETPPLTAETAGFSGKSLDELVQLSLRQRNDVQAQKFNVESTDWDVTRARSGYFPRLDLLLGRNAAGSYLTQQIVNGADALPQNQRGLWAQLGNQVTYSATLNLTWSIFDRFLTRYNVSSARTTWQNAQIDRSETDLQVVADVRIAHSDYQIALRQIQSAEVGLKAAQEAYNAITGRYSVGAVNFIDVLAAQAALAQARTNQAQAIVNLKLREKTLSYAIGSLSVYP